MIGKTSILVLALAGLFFAGPYTEYCYEQQNPCFESNCYKVEGTWEMNPDTGKIDCMYDTVKFSDAQMKAAFSTCLAGEQACEQEMAAGGSYTYQPSGSGSSSSSGGCCGPALILASIAGLAVFCRK